MGKEIEKIKFYCKPVNRNYWTDAGEKYELMPRDASKKMTPANEKFMGPYGKEVVMDNNFSSLRILGSRDGTSYYYFIGIEVEGELGYLQIRADQISGVFENGTMIDGELIGNFKFTLSGSHTTFGIHGNQKRGTCKYWLKQYAKYKVFDDEATEGILKLIEGSDDDINMATIMIEARKGDYYKLSFGTDEQ